MITTSQILLQIEKHIQLAKNASSNQATRDEFVAIKTLCEAYLMLEQDQINSEIKSNTPNLMQPITTMNSINNTAKIDEDGANGDSIFDF